MDNAFTSTRIRTDVYRKLKEIADKNNRSVPMQIAHFVEREEAEVSATRQPAPAHPQEPQP